jgi:hypothetical protein
MCNIDFALPCRSGYLYETTFKKEVLSDLTGERGVLMGAIQGLFLAQYEVQYVPCEGRGKGRRVERVSGCMLRLVASLAVQEAGG